MAEASLNPIAMLTIRWLRRTSSTGRYNANSAWTYDDEGRMLTESLTYSGQTYPVTYHYDNRGRLDEITYPSGRKAAYTFDQRNSLDKIKWQNVEIEDRNYDDLARLNAVVRAGSAVDETRSYDNAGRLTSVNNTNVGDATYAYDANHNKLSETWTGAMAAWNFVTTNSGANPLGYDDEDRFVHFAQASQSNIFNFTRSDIGNINNINLNGTGTARGFNNIHALTSIGSTTQVFNPDGNLTTSHAGHTNTWDEAGMMKTSLVPSGASMGIPGTNDYGYDADRKRVWKKITRNGNVAEHSVFVHAGPNLIAQYPSGTAAASPTQEYVYAQEIDSLVMLVLNGGITKLTITRNQQWSVTALSDSANGNVLERYTYDHFGKRTILEPNGTTVRATSSYNMPFGYTSREHDAETGICFFRARYYDPATSEFSSPDPLEYVDGMSLFRGYFGFESSDPKGLAKCPAGEVLVPACCKHCWVCNPWTFCVFRDPKTGCNGEQLYAYCAKKDPQGNVIHTPKTFCDSKKPKDRLVPSACSYWTEEASSNCGSPFNSECDKLLEHWVGGVEQGVGTDPYLSCVIWCEKCWADGDTGAVKRVCVDMICNNAFQ